MVSSQLIKCYQLRSARSDCAKYGDGTVVIISNCALGQMLSLRHLYNVGDPAYKYAGCAAIRYVPTLSLMLSMNQYVYVSMWEAYVIQNIYPTRLLSNFWCMWVLELYMCIIGLCNVCNVCVMR